MQIKTNDQAAHLPVFVDFCEIHTAERSARSEAAEEHRRKRREKKEEEETSTCVLKFRNAMVAATLAALMFQGRGLLDPPWPSSLSALTFAALPWLEWRLEEMGRLLSDRFARAESTTDFR